MSAVTMTVPKGTAPFTLTYGGHVDRPVHYKPSEASTVQVEREHLREFLRVVPGAEPASGPAESAVQDVQGQEAQVPAAAGATARRAAPPR